MRKIDQIRSRERAARLRRPRHEHNKRLATMSRADYVATANLLADLAPHAVRSVGRDKYIKVAKRYLFDEYGHGRLPHKRDIEKRQTAHASAAATRAFAERFA